MSACSINYQERNVEIFNYTLFKFISFYFMHFEALLLGTCTFWISTYFLKTLNISIPVDVQYHISCNCTA